MRLWILVLLVFLFGCKPENKGNEKIWSGKESWKERRLRSIADEKYPELSWGFYQFSGSTIIGVLEDFDNHQVLLFVPYCYPESVKISRNGKELSPPFGRPEVLRMARVTGSTNQDGETVYEEDFTQETNLTIGFWIPLKVTDSLKLSLIFDYPAKGEFEASYDPDNRWRMTSDGKVGKKGEFGTSDVYDLTKGSMLAEVRDVLEQKESCRIRFTSMGAAFVTISNWEEEKKELESKPLTLKLNVGDLKLEKIQWDLSQFYDASRAAGFSPQLCLEVGSKTKDESFREVLGKISLLHNKQPVKLKWVEE